MGTVAIKLPVGEIFLHLSGKSGVLRREKSEEEGLNTKEQSKKNKNWNILRQEAGGTDK